MKNYPFIITVLIVLFLFSSCQKQPTKTVISGTIVGADVSFVSYSPPIEGLCFAGFVDMVSVNSSGEFIIVIDNMKDASFCFIKIPEISFYHYFIVEPEGSVQLLITNSEESVRVDMEGMNAKGLECYMQAERKSMELISNRLGEVGISNLPDTILALKEAELIPYKELYARSLISHSFYKLVSAQIECLYGAAHSLTLYKKIDLEDRDETLISSLKDVCRSYPVDNEMFSKTHTWFDYVSRYVELYIPLFENYGREELFKKQQEGTLKTYYMENAGRVLSAKQLAFFKSSSIYFTSLQQQFPKEITAIYEQMLKEYPRNPWKHYLTSYAADVQAYHSIIEKPFGEGVIFVENYSEINFLREVVALFKGKKVYIDVWATWCAPCKSEFQHKQALKEYLQETDTEIVYISFDEDDRDTTWQEMIKYYGLDGYHLRVNPALRADLFVQYDNHGRIAIPWYILFDEEGNIMEKHAPAPSEIATGRK